MWEAISAVGVWVEAIALIFIFGLDWKERKDNRKDREEQHKETSAQLEIARNQAEATKKSADAAIEAALAAKKSADITAALHRPFMGLLSVTTGWSGRVFHTQFTLKNYGTLPAQDVGLAVDFFTDNIPRGKKTESESVQIFPTDQFTCTVPFDVGDQDLVPIQNGTMKLRMDVRIPYQSDEGREFEYLAHISYSKGQLQIDKSETHAV
jgi:hypothetical protein